MQTNKPAFTLDTFPILNTDRLDLVEIKQSHLGDLYKLFSDENVTRFYNLLPLKNEQEAQKSIDWFQTRFKDKLGIRWGIAFKGQQNIIGTVGFNNYCKQHRANIGYDLQTEHWNNGFITEALKTVINFGFSQLEINRIEAEVMIGNIVSEKVLEKLNFKNEGILRQWMFWNERHYDMIMFSLLKTDYETKRTANS
jgi:[ribosomal protein S5]-alanine N-acetyltransferase